MNKVNKIMLLVVIGLVSSAVHGNDTVKVSTMEIKSIFFHVETSKFIKRIEKLEKKVKSLNKEYPGQWKKTLRKLERFKKQIRDLSSDVDSVFDKELKTWQRENLKPKNSVGEDGKQKSPDRKTNDKLQPTLLTS